MLGSDASNESDTGVFEESALEAVKLPQTLKRIQQRAFTNCKCLKNIILPKYLKEIDRRAFAGAGLVAFTANRYLRTIGEMAFLDCRWLLSVHLNKRLRNIGSLCFFNAPLKDVTFPLKLRGKLSELEAYARVRGVVLPDAEVLTK